MDTLVHCLESFLSTSFNPPADGIALDGLRRTACHIEAAVHDGSDITARREMLAAALNAGLASEKGSGGIEAAAKALEAAMQTRHGVLHGALLREVLLFNTPAISDRFALTRKALDLAPSADIAEHLVTLAERIGLPRRLSNTGLMARHLPPAALRAAADPANRTNPRLATAEDYERMMRAAF
jgi:alcohol dehydrogenase class IV